MTSTTCLDELIDSLRGHVVKPERCQSVDILIVTVMVLETLDVILDGIDQKLFSVGHQSLQFVFVNLTLLLQSSKIATNVAKEKFICLFLSRSPYTHDHNMLRNKMN